MEYISSSWVGKPDVIKMSKSSTFCKSSRKLQSQSEILKLICNDKCSLKQWVFKGKVNVRKQI
jgi:hypothetical protein